MKLYIKSSVDNGNYGKICIYDNLLKQKYCVDISHSVLGMKLDLYNENNKKVAKIRQRDIVFNKTYRISSSNRIIKVVAKFLETGPKFCIKGINWEFNGNLLKKDFRVIENSSKTEIMRQRIASSNIHGFELDIENIENEIICICIALCIDTLLINDLKESNPMQYVKDFFKENNRLEDLQGSFSIKSLAYKKNIKYKKD